MQRQTAMTHRHQALCCISLELRRCLKSCIICRIFLAAQMQIPAKRHPVRHQTRKSDVMFIFQQSAPSVSHSSVIRIIVKLNRLARMGDGEVYALAVRTRSRGLTKCRTRYAGNSRVVTRTRMQTYTTAGWQRDQFQVTDEGCRWYSRSAVRLSLFVQYFLSLQLSKIPQFIQDSLPK